MDLVGEPAVIQISRLVLVHGSSGVQTIDGYPQA
jgi:hypothetical protein